MLVIVQIMHDEVLIEFVRTHRALYDFSHPKYWDSDYKNKLWDQIGKKLNAVGPTCRSRWHNIRDQYRKTLKKTIAKKGQNAKKKVRYYKYHEQMSFMNSFFHEREKKETLTADDEAEDNYSNLQLKSDNEDASSDSSRPDSSMDTYPTAMVCLDPPITAPKPSTEARHPLSPDQPSSPKATTSQERKEINRLTNTTAYLMEYILEKNEKELKHPVDKFLESIAPTLKSLKPYYQNLAKSEVFATVQRYEMLMLKELQDLYKFQPNGTRTEKSSALPDAVD